MVYPKCQPLIKASLNQEISEGGSWQQGHVTRPSLLLSLCHQGTNPVPNPSQPTRRLIRLSSPERQRLSSLHLTPDPEMEPPPKPPRSCSTLAHQALEASFKGWGMPVQSPQGSCWLRVGMAWVVFGFLDRGVGHGETGIPSPPLALLVVMLSKAHLTSHSRMSGSRSVITPS